MESRLGEESAEHSHAAGSPARAARSSLGGFVLFLAAAFYAPVVLIWLDIIPFAYRFRVLLLMAGVLLAYSLWRGRSRRDIGFRTDTLKGSLAVNGALSALLVAALLSSYAAGLIREPVPPEWGLFYPFYVFVSGPAQEFIYRSVLFSEMEAAGIRGALPQVLLSAVTYSFLHVIYNDAITLAVTLLMGVVWGLIYRRYPNFWGVALSHATLGAVSIAVGLV